jgi:hypothetical protein
MVLMLCAGIIGQFHSEWGKIMGFLVALPSGWLTEIEEIAPEGLMPFLGPLRCILAGIRGILILKLGLLQIRYCSQNATFGEREVDSTMSAV